MCGLMLECLARKAAPIWVAEARSGSALCEVDRSQINEKCTLQPCNPSTVAVVEPEPERKQSISASNHGKGTCGEMR